MLPFTLLAFLLAGLASFDNLATAKRLAGEGHHFLVLQRNGQVFAAGFNDYGQLGRNTITDVLLPRPMLRVTNATDISTGSFHSCVLDQGNRIKCAGSNRYYQLGDGTKKQRRMLVPTIGLGSKIAELNCGYYASCARMTNGGAQCWGHVAGSLKASPSKIAISGGIQSISVGSEYVCFVAKVGGKLYCMSKYAGNATSQKAPVPVVGLAAENIVSVACGKEHACAVNAAGAMFCWGSFSSGRLGNPSVMANSLEPVQVLGITSGAASAWLGWDNSFAIMQNSTVLAFGADQYGVFGTGSKGNQAKPIVYGQGVSGVVEVRGGYLTTCVLLQNDQVKCTGNNLFGQLGVGNNDDSFTLVEMHLRTSAPTRRPTKVPTVTPTKRPTKAPTAKPTKKATLVPTKRPTKTQTAKPTKRPTSAPTKRPTKVPTETLTKRPTKAPTTKPTKVPTEAPTKRPTTAKPVAAS